MSCCVSETSRAADVASSERTMPSVKGWRDPLKKTGDGVVEVSEDVLGGLSLGRPCHEIRNEIVEDVPSSG